MTAQRRGLLVAVMLVTASMSGVPAADSAATPVSKEAVMELIRAAESSRSQAAELRAEWLETGDLIDEARKLAERGDLQQAAERAERARQQGVLAIAQAERESAAWQRRVVQ